MFAEHGMAAALHAESRPGWHLVSMSFFVSFPIRWKKWSAFEQFTPCKMLVMEQQDELGIDYPVLGGFQLMYGK